MLSKYLSFIVLTLSVALPPSFAGTEPIQNGELKVFLEQLSLNYSDELMEIVPRVVQRTIDMNRNSPETKKCLGYLAYKVRQSVLRLLSFAPFAGQDTPELIQLVANQIFSDPDSRDWMTQPQILVWTAAGLGTPGAIQLLRDLIQDSLFSMFANGATRSLIVDSSAKIDNYRAVESLLMAGIEPHIRDGHNLTLLSRAAWNADLNYIQLLLQYGAGKSPQGVSMAIEAAQKRKESIQTQGRWVNDQPIEVYNEVISFLTGHLTEGPQKLH